MTLDSETRARKHAAQRELRGIKREEKALRPLAGPKVKREKRDSHVNVKARERDLGFLSWLHEGIPCVACLIEGPPANPHGLPNPLEAAHQHMAIGSRSDWNGRSRGRKGPDEAAVILCRFHHQILPNACDRAQRKFWDRLGLGDRVADLCDALLAAFRGGSSGAAVVRRFAAEVQR